MKPTGRLHLYPPTGPQGTGYIVADKTALRRLSDAAKSAAVDGFGFETLKVYSSDGHEYELILTSAATEDEWQTMKTHYAKESVPEVETIKDYQQLKLELNRS